MTIISQIFPSEMDAMTSFLSKVFEDCINEYLSAVLACSKEKESLGVFLYTVASCVHCCTQLVDFLGSRGEVDIRIEPIKKSLAVILKPNTERYVQLELEFLQKRVNTELEKINKAVKKKRERIGSVFF